jgi:cytochrome bd ubiquinol oxidase subunit II
MWHDCTTLATERIAARWFSLPNFLFLWPMPILTAAVAWCVGSGSLMAGRSCFFCRDRSLPARIPRPRDLVVSLSRAPSLTVWETAAVPASQIFVLLGVFVLLPIILIYIGFVYWSFRGKVREGEGYH